MSTRKEVYKMKQSTQQRLNQLMSERGLKQVDILNMSIPLQERTGIKMSKSHLSQYVNGKSQPDQHKLYLLAKTLNVSEAWLLGYDVPKEDREFDIPAIETIYKQLNPERQTKVYNFAEKQLEEQNSKITSLDDYRKRLDFPWKGFVSAGTGEFLDGEVNETISLYDDEIPTNADFALTVNGDSMKPMFKDHETIFVEETTELINGSIGIVIVNDEAYVKKVYHSTFGMTLVSLNDDYKDINVGKNDFIKIIGKVVI